MAAARSSLKSVSVLTACSVGYMLLQFALQLLLAKWFGAATEVDAYRAALGVPFVVSTVLVGSLAYVFVPSFVERRDREGEQAAWRLASNVIVVVVITCTGISLVGCWFALPLMRWLHPGFDSHQTDLAAQVFRIATWLALTHGLIGVLKSLYHCHERFFITGAAPLAGAVTAVAYAAWMHDVQGVSAVATGVLLGSIVNLTIQMPLALRHCRISLHWDQATRDCFRRLLPLVLGAAYYSLDLLVNQYLASRGQIGTIARLGYATQFAMALLTLSSSALAIVAFPAFARHAAKQDRASLRLEIAASLRFLTIVLVPVVAGLLGFSHDVVSDLLQRGRFTAADTEAVAFLLTLYSGMIVGGGLGEISAKVFYALKDTRTPVAVGVTGFTIGVVLKILLVDRAGVAGIVGATSFYYCLNAVVMLLWLRHRLGSDIFSGVFRAMVRAAVATVPALLLAYGIVEIGFAFASLPAAGVGAIAYMMVLLLLRNEFALRTVRAFKRPASESTTDA